MLTFTTEAEYMAAKAKCDALDAWVDTKRNKRNGWASYHPSEIPAGLEYVDNETRGAIEVWEFLHNPPEKYFLYVSEKTGIASNFPGHKLGTVSFGRPFKSPAFGGWPSTRVPVTIRAINGLEYVGTYFKSSGDYARIRLTADSKRKLARQSA